MNALASAVVNCPSVFIDELRPDGLMDLRAISHAMRRAVDCISERVWCVYWRRVSMDFVETRAESVNFARFLRSGRVHVGSAKNNIFQCFDLAPSFLRASTHNRICSTASLLMDFKVHPEILCNDAVGIVGFRTNDIEIKIPVDNFASWYVGWAHDHSYQKCLVFGMIVNRNTLKTMLALRQSMHIRNFTVTSLLAQNLHFAYEQSAPT